MFKFFSRSPIVDHFQTIVIVPITVYTTNLVFTLTNDALSPFSRPEMMIN